MKSSILITALILLGSIINSAYAQNRNQEPKPPSEVVSKMIILKGDEGWKDTGIALLPGDKVTINASGKVYFSNGMLQSGVTPDGLNQMQYKLNWSGDAEQCQDPKKNLNHAALIAEVGKSTFQIGESQVFSGKNGKLYIGINDCSLTGNYYNTGKFQVNIKVVRGTTP